MRSFFTLVVVGLLAVVSAWGGSGVKAAAKAEAKTGAATEAEAAAENQSQAEAGYYIVSFQSNITNEDRVFLKTHAQVLKFFPPHAYIVQTHKAERLRQNPRVAGLQVYDKSFRFSRKLKHVLAFSEGGHQQAQGLLPSKDLQDQDSTAVLPSDVRSLKIQSLDVSLFSTASRHKVVKRLKKLGFQKIQVQGRFLRVKMGDAQVKSLGDVAGVEYVNISPVFQHQVWKPNQVWKPALNGQTRDITDQLRPARKNASSYHLTSRAEEGGHRPPARKNVLSYHLTSRAKISGYETGTRLMKFAGAWERNFTGYQQVVGIVDSGLDTGNYDTLHEDMAGAVLSGQGLLGETIAKAIQRGSDFDVSAWHDDDGHGTHVASSIVGRGLASPDAIFRGGAFDARLHVHKVHTVYNPVLGILYLDFPTNLTSVFHAAYEQGVRVHNNSWGAAAMGAYTINEQQVDEFIWQHPDFVLLFAAGNEGAADWDYDGRVDLGSIGSPASAKNIIAVGASENYLPDAGRKYVAEPGTFDHFILKRRLGNLVNDPISDNPNGIAVFSGRGPTQDQRIKPDIVAPGTNILSLCSTHERAEVLWGALDGHYCFSGGTSMATPLVTAAAALVRQALQQKGYEQASAALIKAILLHTATDLFPGQFGFGGNQEMLYRAPNNQQGYGRVDAAQAVAVDKLKLLDEHDGVKHGRSLVFELSSAVRKLTLVYTDAPGSPAAPRALVNNVDLYVKLPSGEVLQSTSERNNIEQVILPHATHGVRVYVRGTHIPFGKGNFFRNRQPFALVAN